MYEEMFQFKNFYLPLRRMDPYAIYVEDLLAELTYGDIKDTFGVFQRSPPPTIVRKEKYPIITFMKPKTVRKILRRRDTLKIKGQNVTVKEEFVQFRPRNIHLPLSFFLPIDVLMPPFFIPVPDYFHAPAPTPAPPLAHTPAPAPYEHPFPEGFSLFHYK